MQILPIQEITTGSFSLDRVRVNPPRKIIFIRVLLVCLLSIVILPEILLAQNVDKNCNTTINDTLFLCAGTLVQIDSRNIYIRFDTLIALNTTTSDIHILRDPYQHTISFYDSLRTVASKNAFVLGLYNILVPNSRETATEVQTSNKTEAGINRYNTYKGLKIKRIEIEQIDVFGPTLSNPGRKPESWMARTGNKLHMTTRESVIMANLLFREGDLIDPVELAENAQLLRALPYFEDAIIEVVPDRKTPGEADIFVITKDLFSFGLDIGIPNILIWDLDVYNQNFLGRGHRISTNVRINAKNGVLFKASKIGYRIDNIRGTFVNAEANIVTEDRSGSYGFKLFRDFFSSGTQVAGGLELYHQYEEKTLFSPNFRDEKLQLNQQVLWLGQALRIGNRYNATNLVFAAALQNNLYSKRPYVDADSNQLFHNSSQVLAGLILSKNAYYTGNYIYQFGRTEDIPYGYQIAVNFGPDAYEYSNRFYTSVSAGLAKFMTGFGYLSGRATWDGYWNKKQLSQGHLGITIGYFSPLQNKFFNKVRHFVTLKYVTGLRRLDGESINVVNELGIGGLDSDDTLHFSGNQKITANVTSMVYTPVYYYGFKLAWFTFANLAWVGPEPGQQGDKHLYSGFGIGCFLRNENLVIKTIKLRAGFYPGLPDNKPGFMFEFTGVTSLQFLDFRPKRPQTINYE
ncbi:MAG TPA: hypothetical protein DCR43_08045 [Bacteroidales bacterium]|nr:MAG: hypothetical protein A2X11_15175 [Bacteroidetes bacterium GWE2_42_24]OFY31684.1 MAG: hypothetical protein A2X09_08920 [Bacteroidetes bacterium GWF2_43_11]HAQ65785.1 hypothetical protein [Bacteroidales bacterium]HBZ67050.1 hypothetical protein [Bacteroidales bacterium]